MAETSSRLSEVTESNDREQVTAAGVGALGSATRGGSGLVLIAVMSGWAQLAQAVGDSPSITAFNEDHLFVGVDLAQLDLNDLPVCSLHMPAHEAGLDW